MAVKKRGETYWYDFSIKGNRYRGSTGTTEKELAQRYEDELKNQIWRQVNLKERPEYTWDQAVIKFVKENVHKSEKEFNGDISKLQWFSKHLTGVKLKDITKQMIEDLANKKHEDGRTVLIKGEYIKKPVTPSTVNRYLEPLRALFRKAEREWEWIDKAPLIKLFKEKKRRIRWISRSEAQRLLSALPPYMAAMAKFSLATGLRKSNVLGLKWEQVNMVTKQAWIHHDEAKGKRAIPVPLNDMAMEVIKEQIGRHGTFVFTYQTSPVNEISNKTWKNACRRAGISDFKWHDLRHTWASWHVQAGTPLQTLMELGSWSTMDMVLRYAHLSDAHLKSAADKINLSVDKEDKLRRVK